MKTFANYIGWFRLEVSLERNSRNLLLTSVVQAAAFVLVFYYGIQHPEGHEWTTFFWLITLFASVSGLSRSFLQAQRGLNLYIYQLIAPKDFFIIRTLSNFVYILTVALAGVGLLTLFYGFAPLPLLPLFSLLVLCALGFAAIFTFTGIIASGSGNATVLLPLLSVPLLIPLLMVTFAASDMLLIPGAGLADIYREVFLLLVLDILYFLPGIFLFPQLWGE